MVKRVLILAALFAFGNPALATTIAYDGKTVAFDSQRTCGHYKTWTNAKVTRIRGALVGCAGDVAEIMKFKAWYANPLLPFPGTKEIEVLVVEPNGKVYTYGDNPTKIEISAPCAIGSGGSIALGAIVAGKTAKEAVEIAATQDIYTGGTIWVETP